MSNDPSQQLRDLVEGARFVMLTSTDEAGVLLSRPMTVQEVDGWTVKFIAQQSNDVVTQSSGREVNLSFADGGSYVSLSGTGSVTDDVQAKRELWNRLNEAYAGEPDDPDNVILEVTAHQGEYWEAGNIVTRVVGLAKAAATGEAPDGEHEVVAL